MIEPTKQEELPKLYFSPYSKDLVRMLYECATALDVRVGLICSRSQVNNEGPSSTIGGYTGFTQDRLAAFVKELAHDTEDGWLMPLCRDHLGKVEDEDLVMSTLKADAAAGFKVVHLHTENANLVRRIMLQTTMKLELGTGEANPKLTTSYVDYMLALMTELRNTLQTADTCVAYLSFPTGCLIQETRNVNRIDHGLCYFMKSFGLPLKGHNSDYADAATLRALRQAGLTALNVAPQLGVLATRAYVTYARTYGYDLSSWEQAVYDGGRWKTWGGEKFSIELGGQYHLNALPAHLQCAAYADVKNQVKRLLTHYATNFVKES